MIRAIVKRHHCHGDGIPPSVGYQTIVVECPELEEALKSAGCDTERGAYSFCEFIGVETTDD